MNVHPQKVAHLFGACLGLADEACSGLLDVECRNDPKLRKVVEGLLAADRRSGVDHFLEWNLDEESDDPFLGMRLGPYQVRERIAAGAMGVVYRADRVEGFEQTVAIKILRPWLCDSEGVARFRAEQQALADLPHPNIARLLDAGVTPDASHYLVLEFIPGDRLDDAVAARQPSLETKLDWFLTLCRTISFAHDRGIAHRDLKPANVLVQSEKPSCNSDEVPLTPMITDFGLAKMARADGAGLTATGEILGTPGYMAPEQLAGAAGDAGFASDIYGLGAVLYFLLTGRPPFRGGSITELIRELETLDPEPPAELVPGVPKDLDTVCLKCLEKRPAERYASAQELGDDIQRFLAGFPVRARPVGPLARVVRWANRNRSIAALAGSLIGVLLIALVVTSTLFVVAEQRRQELESEREAALTTIDELMTKVSKTLQTQPATNELRTSLLTAAKQAYDARLAIRHSDKRRVEIEAATSNYRLAQIHFQSQDYGQGVPLANLALGQFRALARKHPENHQFQFDVFHCLLLLRKNAAAHRHISALAEQHPLPDYLAAKSTVNYMLAAETEDAREAVSLMDEAFAIDRSLVKEFPNEPRYRRSLANGLFKLGERRLRAWDHSAALQLLTEAIRMQQRLVVSEPSTFAFRRELTESLMIAGRVHLWLGKSEQARTRFVEASKIAAEATEWSPTLLIAWRLRAWALQICIDHYDPTQVTADNFEARIRELNGTLAASAAIFPQAGTRLGLIRAAFFADCPLLSYRDLDEAVRITQAYEADSQTPQRAVLMGIVQLRAGENVVALNSFRKAWDLNSRAESARWLYPALAAAHEGDFSLADRYLEELKPLEEMQLFARLKAEIESLREKVSLGAADSLNGLAEQRSSDEMEMTTDQIKNLY